LRPRGQTLGRFSLRAGLESRMAVLGGSMNLRGFCAVAVLILISGCSTVELDPILKGQNDCYPPCWHQIQPGITTMTKALEVIKGLDGNSQYQLDKPFIYFSFNDHKHNRIHVSDDEIVDWIEFNSNPSDLSQVISMIGEPESLLFRIDSEVCVVDMFFLKKGIYFQGECKASLVGDYWTITPKTKLYTVYFIDPQKQLDDLLLMFFGEASGRAMKDAIRPWSGYGKYPIEILNRPN